MSTKTNTRRQLKISHLSSLQDKEKKINDECETKLDEKTRECLKLEVMNLEKELKDAKDQISNGLNLKAGKEIWEFVLQFHNNEEFGECSKINEEKGTKMKNATKDKKNFMSNQNSKKSVMNRRPPPIFSRYLSFKGNCFSYNKVGHKANECRN